MPRVMTSAGRPSSARERAVSEVTTRSIPPPDGPQPARTAETVLTLVVTGTDLSLPPGRHRLRGIDVVTFARGRRAVVRDADGGPGRLQLHIPDPFLSRDHGRMLRVADRWVIEGPHAKNGIVVNGRVASYAPIEVGDVFELGRCVFMLERIALPEQQPCDHILDPGRCAQPLLASLHPDLAAAERLLGQVARSTLPVVFHGETGTGKEIYARALHEASGRSGPFVAVNCGALAPSLLEAELFGHRQGAFSGATADRPGYVRASTGGTLFLDEIAALSEAGQIALLRVLQEHEVVPVGDARPVRVDLRVCAASQRPLLQEVEAGRMRGDLYARLLGCEIGLAPLRERRSDLGLLISSLLQRLSPRRVELTPAALRCLIDHDWPHNVRELQRCLATALVLAGSRPIDAAHLPPAIVAHSRARTQRRAPAQRDGDDTAADERSVLAAKLTEHRGNVSAVARELRKHREQIQRMIRRFGFDIDLFRRGE